MKEKATNKKPTAEKLMPQILKMLDAQGGRSLEQARKCLSAIGIEDQKARESLEIYASNWNDVIHPAILSLSSDAVSKRTPVITDLQVMILLLTASMDIHDDVMDKSVTKNNKPTLYGQFGEDLAILIGDALLMEGFLRLYSTRNSMDPTMFDRIVAVVKNTLLEVGNAHLMELHLKKNDVLAKDVISLIEKKAAIFEGIAEIGAIAGRGSNDQINTLKASARAFGYLVMIREEFIDVFEPAELKNRLKNEYLPLPILCAIENPKVKNKVMTLLSGKMTKNSVQELVHLVFENQNVIELKNTMENRVSTVNRLLQQQYLIKKPALLLATLIKSVLEDL
jgi:geranylgeranyl pyrophosphate synthase